MNKEQSSFFLSLVGHEYDFYGIDLCAFCIGLNGHRVAFEAVEDPDDGYRSYLNSVVVSLKNYTFFHAPIARVALKHLKHVSSQYEFTGYRFIDVVDGHVWLSIGTDFTDDYYPCFIFDYRPKTAEITPTV